MKMTPKTEFISGKRSDGQSLEPTSRISFNFAKDSNRDRQIFGEIRKIFRDFAIEPERSQPYQELDASLFQVDPDQSLR